MADISHYIIRQGKLWQAFSAEQRPVLLIDEIDKADIEFPNDLMLELDRMALYVYETGELCRNHHPPPRKGRDAGHRQTPLPRPQGEPAWRGDKFLLRAALGRGAAQEALHLGATGLDPPAVGRQYRPRSDARPRARPSPASWCPRYTVLCSRLLKTEQDLHLFEKLAFLALRGS